MRLDLHVKTAASVEGLSTIGEILASATVRKIKGLAFADRGLMRGSNTMGDLRVIADHFGIKLFSATLIMTDYGEMIIYGLDAPESDLKVEGPKEISSLIDWSHERGAAVVWSHPSKVVAERSGPKRDGGLWSEILKGDHDWWLRKIDAIEMIWRCYRGQDGYASDLAERFGKRVVKSSGACWVGHVGGSKGEWFSEADVATDMDLVQWLRTRT